MIKHEKTKKLTKAGQKAEAHKFRLQGLSLKPTSLQAKKADKSTANKKQSDKKQRKQQGKKQEIKQGKQQGNKQGIKQGIKQGQKKSASSSSSALKRQKWIKISPYGVVAGMIPSVSAVLFKGKHEEERFVVWLSELKSRIAVEQNLNQEKIFDFAHKIFSRNNCLPKQCLFVHSSQGRSRVLLYFENSKDHMGFYADEVVCFCMMSNCQFFCTEEFLKQASNEEIPQQFRKEALSEKPLYLN